MAQAENDLDRGAEIQVDALFVPERIKVAVPIFSPLDDHVVQAGWLMPGAGRTEWFKDFDSGPDMLVIPAGVFMMGSNNYDEKPPHRVLIGVPFAVSVTPITRGQFAAFVSATNRKMGSGVYRMGNLWKYDAQCTWRKPGFLQQDDHPVVCVSWHDAIAYAAWLEQKSGKHYRLLSEAEWEYCCRSTTDTAYSTGEEIDSQQANYGQFANGTTSARRYPSNLWGLHDVHGNVWEWCADDYHVDYVGAPSDGSAWMNDEAACTHSEFQRVVRGGSWNCNPVNLRTCGRNGDDPDLRINTHGFRVALDLSPRHGDEQVKNG